MASDSLYGIRACGVHKLSQLLEQRSACRRAPGPGRKSISADADPAALPRNRGSDTLPARSAGSRDVPANLARRTPTRPDLARVRLLN